ncbi:uncharacterized protein Eint_091580 [Encephalitozoon intestinalis ATCC 50506]|uniref:Uncharacterized protein n=1 Tax=Encephalitozoon intestinalis (strain ATCC 50506) TaxID=876142 RepID=E0S930_ENCIT|nr:uncharacterized protein Eint_091580 [Encephalitozoon intestinalis ATCC 50506]ADM12286.1 hypothetical protein Eint_091580 [Encephalitozoon intestinalis ATCC 50506]UTX46095.1 hypothetical protein GPK93_09g16830 [Encephalitozoon intestinalis]
MDIPSIILRLLTDGIVDGEYHDSLSSLNELLRPIQYEAVGWPDGSCIVLKDNHSSYPPDSRTKEIEDVFKKVVRGISVSGEVVDMLIRERWMESTSEGYRLSKRSLVQHKDFILGLGEGYTVCDVCGFLRSENEVHKFCKELLESERGFGRKKN